MRWLTLPCELKARVKIQSTICLNYFINHYDSLFFKLLDKGKSESNQKGAKSENHWIFFVHQWIIYLFIDAPVACLRIIQHAFFLFFYKLSLTVNMWNSWIFFLKALTSVKKQHYLHCTISNVANDMQTYEIQLLGGVWSRFIFLSKMKRPVNL
jgi:hypothetical protein